MSDDPRIEPAGGEVDRAAATARLPGAPRGDYAKLPTGPVRMEPLIEEGPALEVPAPALDEPAPAWEPDAAPAPRRDDARLAPWALIAAIVSLAAAFFVSWGLPLAIISVVAAIMALRRPLERRAMALWALVLGLAATVYSVGWLLWAMMQLERLG